MFGLEELASQRHDELTSSEAERRMFERNSESLQMILSEIASLREKLSDVSVSYLQDGEVSVKNLDEVKASLVNELNRFSKPIISAFKELSKSIDPIIDKISSIKIPEPKEFPSEIKVSNLEKQIAPLSSVSVNNLSEIKDSIQSLYTAISKLSITVPEPIVNVSPANVSVEAPLVNFDVSRIILALDSLKYISDRADKPISVRMSDGHKFVKAIQDLKKSTDELGVVYSGGSGGVTAKELRAVITNENNGQTSKAFSVKITEVGNITYIAKALPGTSQATAKWQAMKLDESSGLVMTWADGNANYDNVSTDLTSLSYS